MSKLFTTPSQSSPGLFRFLMAGALSLVAASCLGVLQLEEYESASEQLCSLYDRCYGPEAFAGCRRHVAGQMETADDAARTEFFRNMGDCLEDCARVSACLDEPLFCGALRENCVTGAQCCGFAPGVATCFEQSCCLTKDANCNNDSDCCIGNCSGGKCNGSVAPVCSPIGMACSINADCCSTICVGNVCANPCLVRGSACTQDTDCCSGKCSNGTCRKAGCFASGALCLSDADCCQDSCDKGRGICGTAGCYADGLPCSQDGDCCAGLVCNPVDKLCASLSCKKYNDACSADSDCCGLYCSGSCQCAPNGTACTDAYKCCTGNCENGSCADCKSVGTACTSGDQCCSGSCNNGLCCNVGCSHSLCSPGAALSTKDCSPKIVGAAAASCVETICAQDPGCCCNGWDQSCVDKVASVCKFVCP